MLQARSVFDEGGESITINVHSEYLDLFAIVDGEP
jgi:hypothetical protein